jgi:hypothetical protein
MLLRAQHGKLVVLAGEGGTAPGHPSLALARVGFGLLETLPAREIGGQQRA